MSGRYEREKKERLGAVAKALAGRKRGDRLVAFADVLYRHGDEEDIAAVSAEDLAEIAVDAYRFFEKRTPGKPSIRVADRAIGTDAVTAVDILCTNRPFILDSVLGEIHEAGERVRFVVHPLIDVVRDKNGVLGSFALAKRGTKSDTPRESFVHVHLDPLPDEAERDALHDRIASLIADVHRVTDDWQPMRARLAEAIAAYNSSAPLSIPAEAIEEAVAFLQWLEDDNFTFLGMREFTYRGLDREALKEDDEGEGLGILRDPAVKVLRRGSEMVTVTPEVRDFLLSPEPLIVSKANVKARVHRRDYMDYIGVKIFDENDRVTGELRVVGLFTSTAYTRSVQRIPFIRRKVARIIEEAGFDPAGHSGKALLNILEGYPRTELFQADEALLLEHALAVLKLTEHPRVRVLARRDRFDRFVSALVYVPRDRYDSMVRERIGAALADLYDGRVSAFVPDFPEGRLARVHFIIGRNPGTGPEPSREALEEAVARIIRTFEDDLAAAIRGSYGTDSATRIWHAYRNAFASDYQHVYPAEDAVKDIEVAERLAGRAIAADFERNDNMPAARVRLKFYHLETPIPLSRRVPLLEHMGFGVINERTYRLQPAESSPLYLHDMTLSGQQDLDADFAATGARLEAALMAVWERRARNDGYNALVLMAGLEWREAAVLRSFGNYMRQTELPYSSDYLWETLARHAAIAADLVALFKARFDPDLEDRDEAVATVDSRLMEALDAVEGLDDDTILRAFRDTLNAVRRTDFFTTDSDGNPPLAITLKIDPAGLAFVEPPRPYREIFVHSTQVEGIHMRFGPIARGGLRWSDRPQDFRVEVLGLVKAQQVKNAVIVPVGAKGGFVPRRLPAGGGREAVFEAGRQAYIAFVNRLLSVTDNIEGDTIVPPDRVVRHDSDDPYLVVAADKGTATFSDTANAISERRGFWLGDAFASGGSAGYDHKEMGITARGAWEAVKRHFRELNVDIQSEPFTVIGVGDMSGDVFGNGMLLSRATRLIAAFNHLHIFIDPDPDPESSWAERKRLFDLGRSSWSDYDRSVLSKGGGVYSRQDKQIALSPQAARLLGLGKAKARPAEVIRAILKAAADLLWFGGIGTYVRAPNESDAEVGDKANDAIRVTTRDLSAKVVGEGANLGMTQRARIAFGLAGGRCNSDAIDNSGGVNSSDVEVNIKIALAPAVRSGKLTMKARNALLKSMTEDVAELVLRNNYQQTLAISLVERRGLNYLSDQGQLIKLLEARGPLDRDVEHLPTEVEIAERQAAEQPLTRAEIGVLAAYAKIAVFDDLVASDVPDDPYLSRELFRYFPQAMQKAYAAEIGEHRLKREIIATQLSNSLINRCSPSILIRLRDASGGSSAALTRAFAAVRDSLDMQSLHQAIDALDTRIDGQLQLDLYIGMQDVLVDRMAWFLRCVDLSEGLDELIGRYRKGLKELAKTLPGHLPEFMAGRVAAERGRLEAGGVPEALAARIAVLPMLAAGSDLILISERTGRRLAAAADAYYEVAERFRIGRLMAMLDAIEPVEYYERLAVDKAADQLGMSQRRMAESVLSAKKGAPDFAAWEGTKNGRVAETADRLDMLLADGRATIAKATVAAGLLAEIAAG